MREAEKRECSAEADRYNLRTKIALVAVALVWVATVLVYAPYKIIFG